MVRLIVGLVLLLTVGLFLTACEEGYDIISGVDPALYYEDTRPPCEPIKDSHIDPCEPGIEIDTTPLSPPRSGWIHDYSTPFTVRNILDGDSLASISHTVVRGTFIPNTARCDSGVPYRVPSYIQPGYFQNSIAIQCYADVRTNAYILGIGPPQLTVQVAFHHYWDGYYAGIAEDEGIAEAEVVETIRAAHVFTLEHDPGIYGREVVLFLGPSHNHATEVWEIFALWDVQRQEDNSVIAVHPDRDSWKELRPDDYETHKSKLELSLPKLTKDVSTADDARRRENGKRIAPDNIESKAPGVTLPMLETDINRLGDFLKATGAYNHEDGPPVKPPPPCGLAVSNQTKNPGLMQDCIALLAARDTLRGTGSLNWDTSIAITSWDGITVAGTPKRVTKVKLANKSLTGSIPEDLADLDGLTELKLAGNSLTGCIPLGLKSVATNDLASLKLLYCRPPAPTGLTAGTVGKTSVPLTWTAVANTSKYRVEYRLDSASSWTVDSDALTGASHTVSGLSCGKKHQFRVSAYGSGTTYAAAWSEPSAAVEATTAACVTPVFGEASYSFTVSQPAYTGNSVGTVSATDPNGDSLTYSITAGNQSLAFAIGGSSGAITLAGVVTGGSSHTLTVEASDGTNKAAATVSVKVDPCPNNDLPGVDQDVGLGPGQPPGCGPDDGAVGPG